MKKFIANNEKGVSVLEVLIVILIGSILVGVAISQFGNSKMQLQRQNVAREFKNNLERARFDSVRRRMEDTDFANMSQIVITSATSYEVRIDQNQDGIISTAEVRTVNFAANSDSKILHANAAYPITIRFNRKGHITTNSTGASVSPLFTICSGNCSAATTITPANGNVISISPTGTVAMLYGGDEIPPLDSPNISNVKSNANINYWVSVQESNSNTNTNTNSSSNTNSMVNSNGNAVINIISSPSPSPTVNSNVATPTPLPTPTPATPTPTPSQLGECPGNNSFVYVNGTQQCVCSPPRQVKQNGKCQN